MSGCCACGDQPVASAEETREENHSFWIRLGVSLVLAGQSMVFGLAINLSSPAFGSSAYVWLHGGLIASALVVICLLGPRLARETWRAVRRGRVTVEALFVASCGGALVGSLLATFTGEGAVYYEVVAIVLAVYSAGKRIGSVSRDRVLREIARVRETFERTRVVAADGDTEIVPVERLSPGDTVRIDPGEAVPVDGVVREGTGYLEQSHLTGEPVPVVLRPGSTIRAGSWSVDGTFLVETTAASGQRRIDGILCGLETARNRPSGLQTWADKTIGWFFPVVVSVAAATFLGWFASGEGWAGALFNAMAVLLVACPCALGLATPIAVWKGMFRLAESGFLCRHGEAFDALARSRRIFFDKTGTLSESKLVVRDFEPAPDSSFDPALLRSWVAAAEAGQNHPVARALSEIADPEGVRVLRKRIFPGRGLEAEIEGEEGAVTLFLGSLAPGENLSDARSGPEESPECPATARTSPAADPGASRAPERSIGIWADGDRVAHARIREILRTEAEDCLRGLRDRGIAVDILSGDPNPEWTRIGDVAVEGSLGPEEKKERVGASARRGEEPLVVGDGINDTPAMAAAAASVSIGEGAALARSASDAVLTGSDLGRLLVAIDLARRVHAGVRSNIRFAVVYNVIGIVLAASGILHPIIAALLMLASSATVSVRALRSAEPTLAANGNTDAARDLSSAENESGFPRSPSSAGPEAPPPFSGPSHRAT